MRYRAALLTCALVLMLGLVGCGGGSGGDPTGPTEGILEVITSTTGSDLDPDGYLFTVDQNAALPLGPNGVDTVASLDAGAHTVTLAGVASNCALGGGNPRTVEVAAGDMARLRFEVACTRLGAIRVSAATTGDDPDPDGYEVALDGGTPKPLVTNGSTLIPGLMPGVHEVALSNIADNCEVSGTNPRTVAVVNGATADTDFSVTCSLLPLVAPGRDVAFGSDGEVHLLSADGATLANLTNNPSSDSDQAWSPDGQAIAFTSDRTGISRIYAMNADGSGQTQLTSGAFASAPAWSPDGSKIAFMATDDGNEEIYLMNPDGSGIAQLTHTGLAESPAWSPDGTRIAFTGGEPDFDIFVMNADGSDVTRITTTVGVDAAATWSPDGTKIAFHSDRSGDRQIHVMNPDGTGVTQLTFGTSSNIAPEWSPEGSKIAFASSRGGYQRLFMMNPDGTEQVPLTPTSYSARRPAWRP